MPGTRARTRRAANHDGVVAREYSESMSVSRMHLSIREGKRLFFRWSPSFGVGEGNTASINAASAGLLKRPSPYSKTVRVSGALLGVEPLVVRSLMSRSTKAPTETTGAVLLLSGGLRFAAKPEGS